MRRLLFKNISEDVGHKNDGNDLLAFCDSEIQHEMLKVIQRASARVSGMITHSHEVYDDC